MTDFTRQDWYAFRLAALNLLQHNMRQLQVNRLSPSEISDSRDGISEAAMRENGISPPDLDPVVLCPMDMRLSV